MKVLYVCAANIGRSQIAEAYHNSFSKNSKASSAGTRIIPKERIDLKLEEISAAENVIKVMKEEAIDVSQNKLKPLSEEMINKYDRMIIMAEPETWPHYIHKNEKVEYWEIPDPRGTDLETHRKVRDIIKNKVEDLLEKLK